MFHQGGRGVVHAAPEHIIRIFGLDFSEYGFEVGGFVGGSFTAHHGSTAGGDAAGHLVGQTFAVLGGIIQHRHIFAAMRQHIFGQSRALLRIGGHHTIGADGAFGGFAAFQGVVRIGGRRRHLHQAIVGIHSAGRNRHARIQMPYHAHHAGIHQFLRHNRALFRVARIVFTHQRQFHFFAADKQIAFGIDFLNRQGHAVFIVFTQVGDAAGFGGAAADFHADFICCQRAASRAVLRGGRCRFAGAFGCRPFIGAAASRQSQRRCQRQDTKEFVHKNYSLKYPISV